MRLANLSRCRTLATKTAAATVVIPPREKPAKNDKISSSTFMATPENNANLTIQGRYKHFKPTRQER